MSHSQHDDETNETRHETTTTTTTPTRPVNPWQQASLLSTLTFSWAYPLLKQGLQQALTEEDLPALAAVDTSAYNKHRFEEQIFVNHRSKENKNNEEPATSSSSLAWRLFCDYWRQTRKARALLVVNMACRIMQAIALGRLLAQFESPNGDDASPNKQGNQQHHDNHRQAYLWTAILVLCGAGAFPTKQHVFWEAYRAGMQYRVAAVAALYGKTLQLPGHGATITAGHLTNLASNDVERFLTTAVAAMFIVLGPIEALVILIVGMWNLGPAFGAGYAVLALLVPLQFCLSRQFATLRRRVALRTDARVQQVAQAVGGARVVKMNAWELEFAKRITEKRREEVAVLQQSSRLKAWNETLYYVSSVAVSVVVFTVHVATGGTLSAQSVFTTFTLLNIVQFTLTKHIPNAVMGLSECHVSATRMQAFLELPVQQQKQQQPNTQLETIPNTNTTTKQESNEAVPKNACLTLLSTVNMTCIWGLEREANSSSQNADTIVTGNPTLSKINGQIAVREVTLELQSGKLYCIIGKVGAGKSALLQALAGELNIVSGTLHASYQSVSFATQDAWIMDGTVRENIIMGLPFQQDWYQQVIGACALQPDLHAFVNGDKTIVGDRGVQCSGGQRARIALARALYCDAEIVLLDDPISAVDASVARTIYSAGIRELCIKRGKCVVLATHQNQFVEEADACIGVDGGRMTYYGSPDNAPSKILAGDSSVVNALGIENECGRSATTKNRQSMGDLNDQHSDPLANTEIGGNLTCIDKSEHAEKKQTGVVRLATWASYGVAVGGWIPCFLFFGSFTATHATLLVTIVMVGKWAEANEADQTSREWFVLITSLTLGMILLAASRAKLSFYLLVRASERLHQQMLHSVLRAKIAFFDTNPIGRILNRFSADVGIADEILPLTIYDFLVGFFVFLGGVATAIVVLPFVLLTLPPLVWAFITLRRIFVATTRELKRLEGLARSPIYAMFSETLEGIVTIRRNGKVPYLQTKFEKLHDAHTRAHFAFIASSRWFAMALDSLAFTLMSASAFLAVLFHTQGWFAIDPAVLGLALTMLIQLATTSFPWMVRQSAEVTNQMVSVERIVAFGCLEPEAALLTTEDPKHRSWPTANSIRAENLSARYRPNLPTCLSGVNFDIVGGQRVGIVGRTGSGKTSLLQVLFRLLEAETGRILIDGVDIATLGLHKLRNAMAIIPQSPVLFSGSTIRENMDPFGKFDDMAIVDVLRKVQMQDAIQQLSAGLDTVVEEAGGNFSNGQRQLLCLARAMLLRTKILVLDEPTASVDRHTDKILQQTIRHTFSDSTILSNAHRLETIIDYDRILVLQDGEVLEFGEPTALLTKENGCFSDMVRNTGEAMSAHLRQRAFDCESTRDC